MSPSIFFVRRCFEEGGKRENMKKEIESTRLLQWDAENLAVLSYFVVYIGGRLISSYNWTFR